MKLISNHVCRPKNASGYGARHRDHDGFVYRTVRWGERNKPIERMEGHLGYASVRARYIRFFSRFSRTPPRRHNDAIKNGRVSFPRGQRIFRNRDGEGARG